MYKVSLKDDESGETCSVIVPEVDCMKKCIRLFDADPYQFPDTNAFRKTRVGSYHFNSRKMQLAIYPEDRVSVESIETTGEEPKELKRNY